MAALYYPPPQAYSGQVEGYAETRLEFLDNQNLQSLQASLEKYRLPLKLSEAMSYVAQVLNKVKLLILYQHFFPLEWANSTKPLVADGETGSCSARELEFLALIDLKLFPIYIDWFIELAMDNERLEGIPVIYRDLDYWQTDVSELRLAWRLLLIFNGVEEDCSSLQGEAPALIKLATSHIQDNRRADAKAFVRFCNQPQYSSNPVLTYLPLAMQVIDHETGCVLLDANSEMQGIEAYWEIEDIEWLTTQNQEADRILAKVEKLLDWLEVAPIQNFKEVIQLWQAALTIVVETAAMVEGGAAASRATENPTQPQL